MGRPLGVKNKKTEEEKLDLMPKADVNITDSLRLIQCMIDRIEDAEKDYKLTPQPLLNKLRELKTDIDLGILEVIKAFQALRPKPEQETVESWANRRAKVLGKRIIEAQVFLGEDESVIKPNKAAYSRRDRKFHQKPAKRVYQLGTVKI